MVIAQTQPFEFVGIDVAAMPPQDAPIGPWPTPPIKKKVAAEPGLMHNLHSGAVHRAKVHARSWASINAMRAELYWYETLPPPMALIARAVGEATPAESLEDAGVDVCPPRHRPSSSGPVFPGGGQVGNQARWF